MSYMKAKVNYVHISIQFEDPPQWKFFSRGIAEVSYPSKHRLKHQGFQTRSENQAPERVSVLDLVKSAAPPPNYCPSGQPSPQVTELSLKEMLISFSLSPAHLYLFDRVFDCKNELPATLLWVLNKRTFLFVDHHLFHVCMLIICGNQFHLNIYSWKGDNQMGLTRFENIIAFNNYDSKVINSFLSRF